MKPWYLCRWVFESREMSMADEVMHARVMTKTCPSTLAPPNSPQSTTSPSPTNHQRRQRCKQTNMAPIRRYLRITRYSVLEVRIYLERPSDSAWLLSSRDPVLERVIQEIRPLVLPRLREENENARRKGGRKKKNVKDVVGTGN